MKYKNVKTGAVINVPNKISGASWIEFDQAAETVEDEVQVQTPVTPAPVVEAKVSPPSIEGEGEMNGITVKQIKQELDAFGVEYDPRAKKKELYELMMSQGK